MASYQDPKTAPKPKPRRAAPTRTPQKPAKAKRPAPPAPPKPLYTDWAMF